MNFYLVRGETTYHDANCCAVVYEESPEEAIRMVQNFRRFQEATEHTIDAWNWQVAEFDGDGVVLGPSVGVYAWIF